MFGALFRFAVLLPVLVACVPQPGRTPPPAAVLPAQPALTERTPDTCRLAALAALQGQPAGNLRTVRLAGPSRVIAPGAIVDQMDYNPQRINAYINDQGIITRLECG